MGLCLSVDNKFKKNAKLYLEKKEKKTIIYRPNSYLHVDNFFTI